MKVQVLQETLAAALRDTVRAVGKSTLPVLENVLVATDEGRLRLTATNLEYGIACWLDAKVEEEGAITVPAKTFAVNSYPLPPISGVSCLGSTFLQKAAFGPEMRSIV
jgi:DNA polymerase-3 subunit beta